MSNPILDKKYLPGKELFRVYYLEMGNGRSFGRLQKWCLSHQIVNPKTLNVPTRMGLWKAMWRWAAKNREEAWEILSESTIDIPPEEWDELIKKHSMTSFQNVTFRREYEESIINER